MSPMRMLNGHRLVGPEVRIGEVAVTRADIEPVRELAATALLAAARLPRIRTVAGRELIRYTHYFKPFDDFDINTPHRFVSIALGEDLIAPSWRVAVSVRSFTDRRSYSKRTLYNLETFGEEVVEAKKTVSFIRNLHQAPAGFQDCDSVQAVTEGKSYERVLEPADCVTLEQTLQATANRAQVMRSE